MARPRNFDIDEAVVTATELFWRNGYDGTSLTDLTEAMAITAPSFYSAFGNKEGLFRKVLVHYQAGHTRYFEEALNEPSALAVTEKLLYGFADAHTDPKHPRGCLLLNCSLPATKHADPIRRELARLRDLARVALSKRLKKLKADGDLSGKADPEGLARYLLAVGNGMAVEAQSGASRKDLYRVAETALAAFSQSKK